MENKNDKKPTLPNKNGGAMCEDKDKTIEALRKLVDDRTRLAEDLLEKCKALRTVVQKLSALI